MLLILLDKRREPGVGLGRIEREGLLRNVLQHTVEPELPHLGHVVRAGLPAAVVVLATAVHHIDLLFAVAVDDTLQADGSDLPLDIVVLQVYDDKRFGRDFDFRIEPARQVDVRSTNRRSGTKRASSDKAGNRNNRSKFSSWVLSRFYWDFYYKSLRRFSRISPTERSARQITLSEAP